MLHINDLTYRIEGRLIIDHATAAIPTKSKVGLVGRNGSGKSTLLGLITGQLQSESGTISTPRTAKIGTVAQEAPGTEASIVDTVLEADTERADLLRRAEIETDPNMIAEIQLRLIDIDAHSAPARAAAILSGLGFDNDVQNDPCSSFSGGWRMRIALAGALFAAPEILLLDEPTNYLDLEGIIWLQAHLKIYPNTVVIVSHDRDLLNNSVDGILHLTKGKLNFYKGNYDWYEKTLREQQALNLKQKKKQDDQRRHLQGFVDRFRAQANKASQAQSRLKALARLQPIALVAEERVAPFHFPSPDRPLAPPLISMEDVSVGYAPDEPVLRDISLRLDPDDRIGLLGANGNGKSTFAKLLSDRLQPLSGRKKQSKKLTVGYFAQHQLDELDPEETPFDHIRALMPNASQGQVRSRLGGLGFGIDTADTKAKLLSGGEKARLLFALASFSAPDLLILDEPTNHLDTQAREALIVALNDYEGAVILIAHDSHLLAACAERLWLVDKGTVASFDGDLEDYRNLLLSERRSQRRKAKKNKKDKKDKNPEPPVITTPQQRQEDRRTSAEQRAKLAPLKRQVEDMEKQIAKLTQELAKLDEALGDSSLYDKDPAKMTELSKQRGLVAKQHAELEDKWLEAHADYEKQVAQA